MTTLPDTVLLIGASGFVGRNLVERWRGRIGRLIAVNASGTSVDGCSETVAIDRLDTLAAVSTDAVVVQVAAHRYDPDRFALAQGDILVNNVDLIGRIYQFCAERGLKEVRQASSVAVYEADLPIMDDHVAVNLNASPNPSEAFYAWSKRYGEVIAQIYTMQYGINSVIFRLSNPYGRYDSLSLKKAHVAPAFVMKALGGNAIFEIRGDPSVERDFVFVDDVTQIFERSLSWRGRTETFNIASGQTTTLLQLAETILRVAGIDKPIVSGAPGAFGPKARRASAEKLQAAFPFARSSLERGFAETIEWYRGNYHE